MTGPESNQLGASSTITETLIPKRAAFIKWAQDRALDVTEDRDAWGKRKFAHSHIESMWEGWFHSPAVVYPADGTVAPFTVINLGSGQVKMGDSLHDNRLPALWFGKGGLGMGVEKVENRAAADGETLAVVTFANVEGLDVLLEVVRRIRRIAFPEAMLAEEDAATTNVRIAELEALLAKRDRAAFIMSQACHNLVVANQATWIEWKNGEGAEKAMEWVENGLLGPGFIPDASGKSAQEYFDANWDTRMEQTDAHPLGSDL